MNHYLSVFSLILCPYEKYIQASSSFSNINQPIESSSLFSNTNPIIMKLSTLAIALLSSAASVLSIPVTDNELVVRGGGDYCETSQVIVAQRYETTKTDILYSAHCDCDSCDYSVRTSVAFANHETFYNKLVADANIEVVEVDKDMVYFKCHQSTEYVEKSCAKHNFRYTCYPKGLFRYRMQPADSRSLLLALVL